MNEEYELEYENQLTQLICRNRRNHPYEAAIVLITWHAK